MDAVAETPRRPGSPARLGAVALALALAAAAPALGGLRVHSKSWDAGRVERGAILEHRFEVVNDGDGPVSILEVDASCGCTVPQHPTAVAPGETAVITLRVETAELEPGQHSKTATVLTDAAEDERFVLQVKLDLFAPLEILPRASVYVAAREGEGGEQRVLARPHRDGMRVVGADSDNPRLGVRVLPADGDGPAPRGPATREGDAWIVVEVAPDAPAGLHKATVTVRTSDPEHPAETLTVNAVVNPKGAARSR